MRETYVHTFPSGPIREHVVPIEVMAKWLVEAAVDLGNEAEIIVSLRRGFTCEDIDAGMDAAVERARTILQADASPLSVAAAATILVTLPTFVTLCAMPARAAELVADASGVAHVVGLAVLLVVGGLGTASLIGRALRQPKGAR